MLVGLIFIDKLGVRIVDRLLFDLILARQHQCRKVGDVDSNVFQRALPQRGRVGFGFLDDVSCRHLAVVDSFSIVTQKAHADVAMLVGIVSIFQWYAGRAVQLVLDLLRTRRQVFQRDRQINLVSVGQVIADIGLLLLVIGQLP